MTKTIAATIQGGMEMESKTYKLNGMLIKAVVRETPHSAMGKAWAGFERSRDGGKTWAPQGKVYQTIELAHADYAKAVARLDSECEVA